MKIDEHNEFPGETVKFTESSRDKEPQTHGILGPSSVFRGSVCSARERATQIQEEKEKTLLRLEHLKQF